MDRTLLLLRALTLAAGVLLVFGLFARLALFRHAPARASRVAWRLVTGVQCTLLANYGVGELLAVVRQWLDHAWVREVAKGLYSGAYLTNGVLDASLPAALLVLSLQGRWGRRGSVLLIVSIAAVGAGGVANGALRNWEALMAASQVTSLLGIGGYLAFCALFILKRLTGIDPYLASLIAVTAAFNLVLPIQEVIFQTVGKEFAGSVWYVNQSLQVAELSAKLVIVLACIRSVRREVTASAPHAVVGW